MPDINGLELAQQLKSTYFGKGAATKLFILSSSISQRDRSTAERLEIIDSFLEKPLSPAKLKQALGM